MWECVVNLEEKTPPPHFMVHHRFDPSFDPSFDPRFELIQEAEKSTQSLGLGLGLPIPYTDLGPQIQLREEIRGDER